MYLKFIIMKYFLFGLAGASALFLTLPSNAMSQSNRDLNAGKFNEILNKRISNLNEKRSCLKSSSNFDEYQNCRTKISNLQNKDFDKFAEKKIKRIDKLVKCAEKSEDFKELKSCKKVRGKKA